MLITTTVRIYEFNSACMRFLLHTIINNGKAGFGILDHRLHNDQTDSGVDRFGFRKSVVGHIIGSLRSGLVFTEPDNR